MGRFDDEHRHVKRTPPGSAPAAPAAETAGGPEGRLIQLQRQAGNAGVAQLLQDANEGEAIQQLLSTGGQALDKPTRTHMESAFGESFEDVRVHTGAEATASAQRLGANAYTLGSDVVFSDGHYDAVSSSGERTLAHELAHVVQQRSGPVDGTDTGAGVKVSDPGDRFERAAEAAADRVVSSQRVEATTGGPNGVQREAAPEEELDETAQGLWVQRDESEEQVPEEA